MFQKIFVLSVLVGSVLISSCSKPKSLKCINIFSGAYGETKIKADGVEYNFGKTSMTKTDLDNKMHFKGSAISDAEGMDVIVDDDCNFLLYNPRNIPMISNNGDTIIIYSGSGSRNSSTSITEFTLNTSASDNSKLFLIDGPL